jgi:hypothetical protein
MPRTIDVSSLSAAEVLRRLHNGARPFIKLSNISPTVLDMTEQDAQAMIQEAQSRSYTNLYFDHVRGRSLKVTLGNSVLDVTAYDQENDGHDAASRALGLPYMEK